jgi:hypothetical protein
MPDPSIDQNSVRVRRGRVGSVDLYEVKDSELDILEKGSPADIQLNFSIFLFSIAVSCGTCLATATFTKPKVESLFTTVTVIGFLGGAYLLIAWARNRTSLKTLCHEIRQRIPAEVSAPPDAESLKPKG